MKILHVYKDYFPPVRGGIEGHINLVANKQRNMGHSVEVLVSNTKNKLEITNHNGIRIIKVSQLGRIASAPINPTFSFWLKRLGMNCDIIHFHLPNPTAVLAYLFSGLKRRIIVTYHSDIIKQKYLKLIYNPFLLLFLKIADVIIATSDNYINSSKILYKFKKKCKVVPLGIDLEKYKPDKEIINRSIKIREIYNSNILLFIGKFRHYKGLNILIDAMKYIDAKLILIGTGYLENLLRRQVKESGLDKKVEFLGEVDNNKLRVYLTACDVFVLPSIYRSEAFGIVQLEAMACSKPLVCTELGTGTSFINKNNETGFVVEPGNSVSLSKAINKLLGDKDKILECGNAAYKRLLDNFTVAKMMNGIMKVYN